jgi:hypothetical protein
MDMSTNKAGKLQQIANMLGRADDFVQGGVRDHILRLPNNGKDKLPEDAKFRALRHHLGTSVHADRNPEATTFYRVGNERGDQIGAGMARALQAGGIVGVTAAGAALFNTGDDLRETTKSGDSGDVTSEDVTIAQEVRSALIEGRLSGQELSAMAAAGEFTRPQLALITEAVVLN